jgi:hypothetical protein
VDRGLGRQRELSEQGVSGPPLDREKIRELKEHLDFVDDRFTHRVRGASTSGSMVRLGPEELERRCRELADYVVELKEVLRQLLHAIDP